MAIHQAPYPPAQPPAHTPPPPQPTPPVERARDSRRGGMALLAIALLLGCVAVVMSSIALMRDPAAAPSNPQPAPPTVPSPTSAEIAAAKNAACSAWDDASKAMVIARQPFLDAPPDWTNPVTAAALGQAQSGILVQVEYLRQHLGPAVPPEVTAGINEFNRANIDMVALDGQHQPAAAANGAADRSNAAAQKLRSACGL